MLTLHLEAFDHKELVTLAIRTLGIVAVEPLPATDTTPTPLPAPTPTPAAATLPVPAPRKKREAKTPPTAAAPAAVVLSEAPVAAATASTPQASAPAVAAPAASVLSSPAVPTIEDLRTALRTYCAANGGDAAGAALLAKHRFERVSLVSEDKRAEIIKECQGATQVASSAAAVPSIDELRNALGELNGAYGMPMCAALLGEFGASRPSEVPEAKRAEFIKACNVKVAKYTADKAAEKALLAA